MPKGFVKHDKLDPRPLTDVTDTIEKMSATSVTGSKKRFSNHVCHVCGGGGI